MEAAQKKPIPAREMHKIVWIFLGVFTLFAATFPTAMMRVSQMEKFRGFHVKSLPIDKADKNLSDRATISGLIADKPIDNNLSSVSTNASSKPDILVATNLIKESTVVQSAVDESEEKKLANVSEDTSQESHQVASNSSTIGIAAPVELEGLNQKLYDQIDQSWQTSPTFSQSLVYGVSVTQEGGIVSYEPMNRAAREYVKETPLPNLLKSSSLESSSTKVMPIGKFTVVFSPSGELEVSL